MAYSRKKNTKHNCKPHLCQKTCLGEMIHHIRLPIRGNHIVWFPRFINQLSCCDKRVHFFLLSFFMRMTEKEYCGMSTFTEPLTLRERVSLISHARVLLGLPLLARIDQEAAGEKPLRVSSPRFIVMLEAFGSMLTILMMMSPVAESITTDLSRRCSTACPPLTVRSE